MKHEVFFRWLMWLILLAIIFWDIRHSKPLNTRLEPPIIAAGSGQKISGGHCAMPK